MSREKSDKAGNGQGTPAQNPGDDAREGRRYSVGHETRKGRRKVRYVETNDPKKGCRYL